MTNSNTYYHDYITITSDKGNSAYSLYVQVSNC